MPVFELELTGSSDFKPLNIDCNYNISFPGSPACQLQIMELFSLHNHMSQSLTLNHIYIYIYN